MTKAKAPSIGDTVMVVVDPRQNNSGSVAPAIVTRVTEDDDSTTLNVTAFTDGPENLWLSDVPYQASRPEEGNDRVAFKKS